MDFKNIFTVLFLCNCVLLAAQTGIGTTTPHASAKLEVSATNKGFLPPRVTLTSATDATTIASPAEGLLVYNLGSVGLQAGYYYWNSANWTTIATASLSGDNVLSANLVKLYQEGYSTTTNKAPSTDGFSFTVPVSGRYEFNFNSTGWNTNGLKIKLTFNIRQGTTVLESDYHESTSSNVWAEYEGRLEVNLNAGITYNAQVVTTTGYRDYRDHDKIVYKQVAGNLPINQHMANRNIQLNNNYLSNDGDNEGIRIDNSGKVGIGTTTPGTSLHIENGNTFGADPSSTSSPSLYIYNNNNASTAAHSSLAIRTNGNGGGNPYLSFDVNGVRGVSMGIDNADGDKFKIQNNWSLNNLNTPVLTITPDNRVGIGNNAPTQALDVTGNVNITGKINVTDPSGNVVTKIAAYVNAGTFVSLDNVKATVTTSGNRGLSIAAVSTTFNSSISGVFGMNGGGGGYAFSNFSITTTGSSSMYGWNFGTEGDTSTYILNDKTNLRTYRITIMIGPGYLNNFISIERLL